MRPEILKAGLFNTYRLVDPITDEVRYIGVTIHPLEVRLKTHYFDVGKKHKTHKVYWLRKLLKQGLEPRIELIDVALVEHWVDIERFWIAYYRACGANLTNETDGGEGLPGRKHSQKSKDLMRQKKLGVRLDLTTEQRKAIGDRQRNKPGPWRNKKQSPESNALRSKALKGVPQRKRTPEENLANSIREKARHANMSPTEKEEYATKRRGGWTEELKQQQSARRLGIKLSEATKKNMSRAKKLEAEKDHQLAAEGHLTRFQRRFWHSVVYLCTIKMVYQGY